jgi:hypothetical protein
MGSIIAVYGAAQDEQSMSSYLNLLGFSRMRPCQELIQEEKNNEKFIAYWPFIFNIVIESLDLRELVLSGRQFTWANCRENRLTRNLTES